MIEKLNYQDKRLIFICVIISVVSLFITQNYYNQAFPFASIDMDVTQEDAKILAEKLLSNKGYDPQDFKHASKFGHLSQAKLFLEYHLSREEAGEILNETNSYYWQNRWFIPEQNEEFKVNISTTGKLAEYEHKIDEDAPGDALSRENALQVAQLFLSGAVDSWDMENWKLENSNITIQKNRIDHQFEWVEKSFDKNGSTHRIAIWVQGSVVDYYNEWIKVPDTWDRDFTKMRSNVQYLRMLSLPCSFIIIFSLFISIFVRSQKKDLRWKTAFIYSGIIAVLLLINKINNIPLEFYSLDTKDTLISFWTGNILMGALLPVFTFFFIGMLIAGAEPFYRDQFPKQISFRHILTIQGIKSRSFFNSAVIGISLTFAWFAFRTIFHLIENKLGGVTTTEVPEFDMLSTFIPFVGVLLIGLRQAILTETLHRMFLIPFLQKYTKSTVFAIVISSIIWGLSHADHGIHQPFYMHFIEISIWGCILGWIFLKYGILTTLIWHFSIKAVPSAMILLQSNNSYYITTGFVSAALVLIPLIYAVISYKRNGGFILSNNLVNALDTEIYEEKIEAREEIKKAAISTTYKPLSRNRVKTGIIIGVIGIFSFIAVTINDPLSNLKKIDKSSAEASKIAEDYLLRRGFDLENYSSVGMIEDIFFRQEHSINAEGEGFSINFDYPQNKFFEYIKETSGKDALRSYLSNSDIRVNDWVIRFFKSETKREYKVWLNAKGQDNGVVYFEETLSDSAYAPSLSEQDALDLVNQFAYKQNINIVNMDLVDNSKTDKGSRIDHFFKYNAKNHKNNIAEAETYFEFEIYGNHIGTFKTGIELPEVWLREFYKIQLYDNIYIFIFLFSIIALFILAIRYLLKLLKDNKPDWKRVLIIITTLFFIPITIVSIDQYPTLLNTYDTSETLSAFWFFQIIMVIIIGIIASIFSLVPVLLVNLGWPGFNNTFLTNNRALYLKDAFVCLFCSMGLYYFYACVKHLLLIYYPTYFPYNMGINSIGSFWFLKLFLDEVFSDTAFYYFFIIGIFYVYRKFTTKGWGRKLFFIIIFSLPIIMPPNNPEPILFILNIIRFGLFIVLFRYFCRGNTWGYLFGIMGYFIIPGILEYFQTIQVPEYRYHLIAAILCMGLFFLYFLREAFFNPKIAGQ